MTDFDKVKKAMQMVAKHKLPTRELREEDFDILAEAAVKAMWLVEQKHEPITSIVKTKSPRMVDRRWGTVSDADDQS